MECLLVYIIYSEFERVFVNLQYLYSDFQITSFVRGVGRWRLTPDLRIIQSQFVVYLRYVEYDYDPDARRRLYI